jgi:phenylalanyl-tRNA synthetase beta chain
MKISLNWLNKHIPLTETPEQIAELLTNCGLEVEDLEEIGNIKGGLNGLVVGEVKSVSQHPNADRLRLTLVDIGGETPLHIVCGAPNVAVGQKVVVAPIGTTIYPLSGESLTMKKAKIRGEESEGMICAEDEIGIGTSHDGILVLNTNCEAGKPIKDYIPLETDTVFEIGLTPNRGDAASHLGIARDLKAILNRPLIDQISSLKNSDKFKKSINITIEDNLACPRYSGILIKDIKVQASPEWLQNKLKAIGINPINNVVDITNYMMHDVGQPMHAFDANKIGNEIIIRLAKANEKLTTLDKVERNLKGEELIIANKNETLALAGVMGGLSSSITETTTTLFLESAWFNAANVRKTAKLHTINSDSSFRFERGIDPDNTANYLLKAAQLILETCGGSLGSELIDIQNSPLEFNAVEFNFKKFQTLSGVNIERETIISILKNLEIQIEENGKEALNLKVPLYRTDVTRDIDVFEEVLRIYGFDKIPFPEILHSAAVVQAKPDRNHTKQTIGNFLAAQGFNEIMSNSLTSEIYFEEAILAKAVKLLNPLSNELAIMRPSLLPGMLEAIAYNKNRKASNLKFYEFGKVYEQSDNGFKEFEKLVIAITGHKAEPNWRQKPSQADYYFLKSMVEKTLLSVGAKKVKGVIIEEVKLELLKKFGIKGSVWYAEMNVDSIMSSQSKNKFKLQDIPLFPEVSRDLSLVIDKSVPYSDIETIVNQTIGKYLRKLSVFDVFEGKPLETNKKSYSINLVLYDNEKTMNDKQIDAIMQKLITTFENQLKAIIRK